MKDPIEIAMNVTNQIMNHNKKLESKMIKVWRFENAPEEYRSLSENGGDEDWVAFIPDTFDYPDMIGWMDEGSRFGCCSVSEYKVEGGIIRIGAHA